MRKLLFGASALILMVSCSGNGTTEKNNEDSTHIADSISQVEAAKEAGHQDSTIQADSNATMDPEAEKKVPELKVSAFYKKVNSDQYSILSLKNIKQYLTDAGFTLKEKGTEKVTTGPYDEVVRYPEWTYENGSLEVEIVTYPNGSEVYYIDFEFADKASADEFIKNAKADGFQKESYGLCKGNLVPLILTQKGKEVKLNALRDED